MKLAPSQATLIRDGKEVVVPISEVKAGDIFAVKAGGIIYSDGIVIEGTGAVNESALTGESIWFDDPPEIPFPPQPPAAQAVECEARRVGEDTTLQR